MITLPEPKTHFTIMQLAKKWNCDMLDILSLGIDGQLELCVMAIGVNLQLGAYDPVEIANGCYDDLHYEREQLIDDHHGFLGVLEDDLKAIQKYGYTKAQHFSLPDWDYVGLNGRQRERDWEVTLQQLVIKSEAVASYESKSEENSDRQKRIESYANEMLIDDLLVCEGEFSLNKKQLAERIKESYFRHANPSADTIERNLKFKELKQQARSNYEISKKAL